MASHVFTTKNKGADGPDGGGLPWRAMAVILLVLAISKLGLEGIMWTREIAYANGPSLGSWAFFASMIVLLPVFQWNWQRSRFSGGCEISLDDAGLTLAGGDGIFAWPWTDLAPFKVHDPRPFRSLTGFRHVRIGKRAEGPASRFLRMWREPGMILDAYDTPLEDIVARLNEYRDRAAQS